MLQWKKIQAYIYNVLPSCLRQPVNNLRMLPYYINWYFAKNGREHAINVLGPLRDSYSGCRCVIIGNGPSLKIMDLEILKNEYTFGLNRIYLLFDQIGFETSFLVSVNGLVMQQFADEIKRVRTLKILNWLHRKTYRADERTVFLCAKPSQRMDGKILNGYFAGSGTVTNLALEFAFFLGFSEIVLIGVDHSYADQGKPSMPVVSKGDDPNHFSPNYFGQGVVWQLPNYRAMEQGYKRIRTLCENNNRRVVDATVDGKLQIFPKVKFKQYLKNSKYKNRANSKSIQGF